MEYKQKLNNLDLKKAVAFLSEQSINFGNKTVITSAFIILLSLNFIVITGIEIEGVTIEVNVVIITIVLQIVNFYYYQQFSLHSEIDNSEGYSDELVTLMQDSKLLDEAIKEKYKSQALRKAEINKRLQEGILQDDEFESLLNESNQMNLEMYEFGNTFKKSVSEIGKDMDKYGKYASIRKRSKMLNISIPKVMFYSGNTAIILRFIIYSCQIFSNQNDPWNYMLEDNLKYYKVIFENHNSKSKIAP